MAKKRRDECLFCTSRTCRNRIITAGLDYDEVACSEHYSDLCRDADTRAPGRIKRHTNNSDPLKRGVVVEFLTRERIDAILGRKPKSPEAVI